ncbi:P-loop containing nucleoside triphosphate hydrolase protein [Staphylotrichum tortipilum]|uniref:RNA helicase n=1 Tax=Staphylotrichum tortipilum TaxID=2831512 RepID=A0AAN6MD48_9PEZI|nr:P-loop containing nucleoside triphosphate hydrolase protein [Staphylotrichum longicolle]
MSAGSKHARSDGEDQSVRAAKKLKKTDQPADAPADSDPASLKAEKKRKEKKEKKDKKDKKEKREKKQKKDKSEDEPATETPDATTEAESTPNPVAKKEKKDKKDKKDKKAKREKQASDDSAESAPKPTLQNGNGVSNGNGTAVTESAPATNGAPAQRNGASYKYHQTKALDAVSEGEIQEYLKKQEIAVSDPSGTKLRPVLQFSHLPSSTLLSKSPFASFTAPTTIQAASWPFALSGCDVIGIAETGSGKTMAFSLPCVEALASSPKPKHSKGDRTAYARAVVVSPTRELAMQTHAAMSSLASLVGLSAVCLYGGAPKDDQRALLRKNNGADIIVATPGRLKDFLAEGCVSLSDVMFAVLDEADRMLDKGFEEDIKLILGSCPPREKRQTLMFTATWPTSVRGLAEGFMVDPVKVTIGNRTRAGGDENGEGNGTVELQANSRIEQKVEVVDPRGKEQRLLELLKDAQKGSAKNDRVLVFCLYKKEAVRVEQFLERRGIRVASIHGDLRQDQRTRSLEAFKAGTTTVLVATDVAARGLDIPEVKLVINVTFPLTIEDYVHRIGRTGRAGKTGKAITLFTEHDKAHSGSLVNILRAANQPVPDELLKFGTTVKKKAHDSYGAFFKDVDLSKKGTKITFD